MEFDFDRIKEQALELADRAKKTAVELADKGKEQVQLMELTQMNKPHLYIIRCHMKKKTDIIL